MPGVAWQTKAAITSKRTLGRFKKFGVLPPAFPMALLPQTIREIGLGVCSLLGMTPRVRSWVVGQFRQPAEQVRALRGKFEEEVGKFKAAEVKVRETCGGKRKGGAGLMEKECRLRLTAIAHSKKAEGLLVQMRAPWGESKKRHLLKSPLPKKMPASTLPPFGRWDVTGGGEGKSSCTAWLWPCMLGGLKFLTWQALMPPGKPARNFAQGVFRVPCTTPPRIAIKKIVCTLQCEWCCGTCNTPQQSGGAPPPLSRFAMPGRECRAMFDACASWVKVPGNMKHWRTGWAPSVLKEIAKVAEELPPVGAFAPLTGNMVPLVVLHQVANAPPPPRLSLIPSLS